MRTTKSSESGMVMAVRRAARTLPRPAVVLEPFEVPSMSW